MPPNEDRHAERVCRPPDRKMLVRSMKKAQGVELLCPSLFGEPVGCPEALAQSQRDSNDGAHRELLERRTFCSELRVKLDRTHLAGSAFEHAERYGDDRGAGV